MPNKTCVEKMLDVLADNRLRTFTAREMAEAVQINYERNWNKRAPRIARKLIARGFATRVLDGRHVLVSLNPRWREVDPADIRRAFAEGKSNPT